ncbi:MAG: hypothetical protein Q8P13_04665 [bacterium]|nr:hypothetical protein [bacterium]
MDQIFVIDYFLFSFFSGLGVILLAAACLPKARFSFLSEGLALKLGTILLAATYFWFFFSKDRNVHTVVEGAQLFFIFGLGALTSLFTSLILGRLKRKWL